MMGPKEEWPTDSLKKLSEVLVEDRNLMPFNQVLFKDIARGA